MGAPRLPSFVIIGTMKSGTTSLFRWLDDVPGCTMPRVKEPYFFTTEEHWDRGIEWYRSLFADVPPGDATGEASVSYTHPDGTERASRRLLEVLPDARLVCVLREPTARLRSHYVHERRHGRERRSFTDAIGPESLYVRLSSYATCLGPWLDRVPDGHLLIVRFDDLVGDPSPAWPEILHHLGLPDHPRPQEQHNRAGDAIVLGPTARRLHGALRRTPGSAPALVRRVGRRVLARNRIDDDARAREAMTTPIPAPIIELLDRETRSLEERLGRTLWDADPGARR